MAKRANFLLLMLALAGSAGALNLSLSQIDASRLLLTQRVDLYVSVTGGDGQQVEGLEREDFRVYESADGGFVGRSRPILDFQPRAGAEEGIAFLLLIDNSGSMYDALDGRPTREASRMRITQAKEAVRRFLGSMTGPRDRVGLAAYNTFYQRLAPFGQDRDRIAGLLEAIRRPEPDQAYTEMYASLTLAVRELAGASGRKAIVVLSDGENYPYARHSGKPHPLFKSKIFAHTEPIRLCQEEGVTVYAINFGRQKDRNVQAIALQTGGQVFDAADREELAEVYRRIHEQVAGEYRLSYRASMEPAEKKHVRVEVRDRGGPASAVRFYFASTVFGLPLPALGWPLLASFLPAFTLGWLATRLKLERRKGPARLQVLQTRVGSVSTRTIPLGGAKTVIGGSPKADLTVAGAPGVRGEHATVLYDPNSRRYTIVADGDLRVNNRPVRARKLEAGDVIDVGGATIVFDDGEI